VNQANLKMSK